MAADLGIGLGALALLIGFPLLLLGVMWVLGALEAWTLEPDERAAAIERLLEQADEADEVEHAVTKLVAQVADPAAERGRERQTSRNSG